MEQTPLPTKTKIAAWWLIGIGIIISLFLLFLAAAQAGTYGWLYLLCVSYCFVVFLGTILPGCLLLLKKKLGWYWFIIVLVIAAVAAMVSIVHGFIVHLMNGVLIYCTIFLVPFILLLLDRKNFWKIAS